MSILLAFEISILFFSIAIMKNSILIYSNFFNNYKNYSKKILFLIQKIFKENNLNISDINIIAVGIGPGSFTNIHIACVIAKGLSFNKNIPIVPVIILKAMAQFCFDNFKKKNILCIIYAKNNKFYWSQYKLINYNWKIIIKPNLSLITKIIINKKIIYCADKFFFIKKKKIKNFFVNVIEVNSYAIQIAKLGYEDFKKKKFFFSDNILPLYL